MSRRRRFEILARDRVHDGFFALDILKLRHERVDGSWSPPLEREVWRIRDSVAILPYDPVDDRVVLIEQFRAGASGRENPWVLEAPAGLLEPGEDAERAARREIVEECGLEALAVERVAVLRPSPGSTSEVMTVFVAQVRTTDVPSRGGRADENEDIAVHVMPFQGAIEAIERGEPAGLTAVLPLRWLQCNRERLAGRWGTACESLEDDGADR